MKKGFKGYTLVELLVVFYIIIVLVLGIGWCMNLYKLIQCDFAEPHKAEIVRGIGVPLAPVGGIMGFIDIDDTPKPK